MSDDDPVWYVAYGSNLLRERFLAYLEGGTFRGREHRGCADPTPPRDEFALTLPYLRYFAFDSAWWGGAVAFLDVYRPGKTLCRAYLITQGQFTDLFAQENGWPDRTARPEGWYRMTLGIGEEDGVPLRTITAYDKGPEGMPGADYLDVIRRGEEETRLLP
jgi:hypothetical protein